MLVFLLIGSSSAADTDHHLRIGIDDRARTVSIRADTAMTVFDIGKSIKKNLSAGKKYHVRATPDGLRINDLYLTKKIMIQREEEGCIEVNGRRYRDTIFLTRNPDGTIQIVNELDVEEYVRGILKHEISPSWPAEALKTQAIISRTYALKNMHRHNKKGYNLCNTSHCQVYGGAHSEDPVIDKAVKKTKGIVLTYKEKLAQTVFFSTCGGYTENAVHVWKIKKAPAYLNGIRCPHCRKAPRFRWQQFISQKHLIGVLKKSTGMSRPIRSIKVVSRFPSGRAKMIAVRYKRSRKKFTFRGNQFRMVVGPNLVRSTLIRSIKKAQSGFLFSGRGWGHGVGLCQWGMKAMAAKGTNFKRILKFYYPGTIVSSGYQ